VGTKAAESACPWLPTYRAPRLDRPLTVYGLGDIHREAVDFDQARFEADVERIRKDPNCAVLVTGDLFQAAMKGSRIHSTYEQAIDVNAATFYFITWLGKIADKIAGITAGNHDEYIYRDVGVDMVEQLAQHLGIRDRYARDGCVVPFEVGQAPASNDRKGQPRPMLYLIHLAHGDRKSTSRASLERTAQLFPGMDAYVSGHTHDPSCFTICPILPNRQSRTSVPHEAICMTSGAYQTGSRGYARRAGLQGRRLGMTRMLLSHTQRRVEGVI
jgi:hypothetical protein